MCFPYDGRFYMLSPDDSVQLVGEYSYKRLEEQMNRGILFHVPNSVGGAFLVNKSVYLQGVGENEYFYGWSDEDLERVRRLKILNLPVHNVEGPLFHLYHPRKENSQYGSEEFELRSLGELLKISGMTQEELCVYIQSWL